MLSNGSGHCPLMPMTGRSDCPSGFALTQPIFQSKFTVAALALGMSPLGRSKSSVTRKFDNERAIVIVEPFLRLFRTNTGKYMPQSHQSTRQRSGNVEKVSLLARLIRLIKIRSSHHLCEDPPFSGRRSESRDRSDKSTTLRRTVSRRKLGCWLVKQKIG